MAAKTIKASDKQAICKKLMAQLKKRYKGAAPKHKRPVLETVLYANCLEDTDHDKADQAYETMLSGFFDLNEIRVSSISEVEQTLSVAGNEEWRALRVRSALQFVFEKYYEFQFEAIRRKTLELAIKNLAKIPNQTNFVRYYTVQEILGSHLIPMDGAMTNAGKWLGIIEPKMSEKAASDSMKSVIKKSEVGQFTYLFRMLATDSKIRSVFEAVDVTMPPEGLDPFEAPKRLTDLLASPAKYKRQATTAKAKRQAEIEAKEAKKKAAARAAARAAAKEAAAAQTAIEEKAARKAARKAEAEAKAKAKAKAEQKTTAATKVVAKPKAKAVKKKAAAKVVKKKVKKKPAKARKKVTKKKAATASRKTTAKKKTTKKKKVAATRKKKAVVKKKTTKTAKKKTVARKKKTATKKKKTTKKKTTARKTTKRRK